jgi:hypothetical protein
MSSRLGSHQAAFNHVTGLIKQPAAPRHPPTIEIVAAGFLRLIQEQTVILLKAITPAARVNSRHAMNQRKGDPIYAENARFRFSCRMIGEIWLNGAK